MSESQIPFHNQKLLRSYYCGSVMTEKPKYERLILIIYSDT